MSIPRLRDRTRTLITRARRKAARWLDPSSGAPRGRQVATSATQPAGGSTVSTSALTVEYEASMAFFRRRHDNYVRLVDAVAPWVSPRGLVLDVGANVGYFTKVLGERLDFGGEAHLFEPIPHLAAHCRVTAAALAFTAHVHEFALGDQPGSVELFVANSGNLGWNTMVAEKANDTMTRIEIEVRRFDDLGLTARPDLVKIDVEGAEHRVLQGMFASLERWTPRPVILCEVGWGANHPQWQEELAAFDRLADLGYTARTLGGDALDVRQLTRTTDVVFVPATA